MLDVIKKDLPNFPNEIIQDWLEPYAKTNGWPPTDKRWEGILYGKPLEFWKSVSWEKETVNLDDLIFSGNSLQINDQLKKAYVMKEKNPYSEIERGEERHLQALKYLLEYGRFPKPICLLKEENIYSVVDGNHRFLAFTTYKTVMHVHKNAQTTEHKVGVASFKETLKRKWGIDELAGFSPFQEVWIASVGN